MIEHLRENSLNPSAEVYEAQIQLGPILVSEKAFSVVKISRDSAFPILPHAFFFSKILFQLIWPDWASASCKETSLNKTLLKWKFIAHWKLHFEFKWKRIFKLTKILIVVVMNRDAHQVNIITYSGLCDIRSKMLFS